MPIQFPDQATKQAYWNTHKPDGAPDVPDDQLIDYIESKNPGEDWASFVVRIRSLHLHSERAAVLTMAVYGDGKLDLGTPANVCDELDQIFAQAASGWGPDVSVDIAPFIQWCKVAPAYQFLPVHHSPDSSDFVWARTRCFLAGAGYAAHSCLASILLGLFPHCPFSADETKDEWMEALRAAHTSSGWPVHLAMVPWAKIASAAPLIQRDMHAPFWVRMLGLLHVLKHVRLSDTQGVVIHYAGSSTAIDRERSNAIGNWSNGRRAIEAALRCAYPPGKGAVAVTSAALRAVLARLDSNNLLAKKPLSALEAPYLAGPWTTTSPDPLNFDGFYQTGLRLTGVWRAKDGVVNPYIGTQSDIVTYDWNVLNPAASETSRIAFESSIPANYDPTWASDIFLHAFPNWDHRWFPEPELWCAARTLFDLPIAASLLRPICPDLQREYPAVIFMPVSPSPSDSTNQGKSQATLTYARAVNPAITQLLSISDSSSAPDVRAVAAEIRSTGSLAVDEFSPPRNSNHLLSHDNFQALCTGSSVASGRVYENDGQVGFRASPVFSAKVFDVPPDIHNRSIAHWLGSLTDEMRARSDVLADVRSGRLSIRMRLGLWAIIESHGIAEAFAQAPKKSAKSGLRFDCHRTLGMLLMRARLGCTEASAYALLDTAAKIMTDHMRSHVNDAVESGLVAAMEFGSALRLRFNSLFDDMDEERFQAFEGYLKLYGKPDGNKPRDFVRAWMESRGLAHRPLMELLPLLTGSRRHASDKAIIVAMAADMAGLLPNKGDTWVLPGDYGLAGWAVRATGPELYKLVCLHPSARTHAT